MSIKYGTVILNEWRWAWYLHADKGAYCTYYLNKLADATGFSLKNPSVLWTEYFTSTSARTPSEYNIALLFPKNNYYIEIGTGGYYNYGWPGHIFLKNNGSNTRDDILLYDRNETSGLYYQTPLLARYAINDNGDWILSFAVESEYTNNTKSVMSKTYIGTKINGKDYVIDYNGNCRSNDGNCTLDYYKITNIDPAYYNSKQTQQIMMSDYLVRDSNYNNIVGLENIKVALTHRGSIKPYLIKDDKGDEYCVVPNAAIGDNALVLKESKG